ncbi:MAG: T9SS type A sorting domain-containing protein [Vicingaceae bacterium]
MKKITLLSLAITCLMLVNSFSQTRYIDEVFTGVTVTKNVKYGDNFNVYINPPTPQSQPLVMDVYEPTGDTVTDRPLIILAHAGSFLPKCSQNTLPLGDKEDSTMVEMCREFAKRGYVAISMDYRLGWNPIASAQKDRIGTIMTAVYLAMQDMKACVRYVKSNSGTYGIDSTKICVGGSNSGGYAALAYGSLNDTNELWLPKFVDVGGTNKPLVDIHRWGDFEGDNGTTGFFNYNNPGPSSDIAMVLNLGGAIGDSSWINAGEVPIINFHGEADSLTPINCKVVIVAATGQPVVEVCGSRPISDRATRLGNQKFYDDGFTDAYTQSANSKTSNKGFMPFYGPANGYEPWAWYDANSPCIAAGSGTGSAANPLATKAKAIAYIDTIMGYFCPRFIAHTSLVGQKELQDLSSQVSVYPNPSSDVINISTDLNVKTASIYDISGKLVWMSNYERKSTFQIDVSTLERGMYLMTIQTDKGMARKKIAVN